MTFGTAHIDMKRFSEHPDCGFILSIFNLDNDIAQADMMYKPLQQLLDADEMNRDIVSGIKLYYMRLTCAQVREGLSFLPDLHNHAYVYDLVKADHAAMEAMKYFDEFTINGARKEDFKKFRMIRNVLTFHYHTTQLPQWYQLELAERAKTQTTGSIFVPNETSELPLRYGLVDELNTVILRKYILQSTGTDSEIIEQVSKLTGEVCVNFLTITAAIVAGVLRDFRAA